MTVLSIDTLESELADAGYDTTYTGTDDYTSFLIRGAYRELELLDAVSGATFDSEDLTEAVLYGSETVNATVLFESVESVEEFMQAVQNLMS